MDSTAGNNLPKFERPPVIETVLGVQFDPLPLTDAHLGAFWEGLGPDWPKVNDAPRIRPEFEEFDDADRWIRKGLQLSVSQDPSARIQIRNSSNDCMIQVQNDRFHYNWLGHEEQDYPQYHSVRPEFDRQFEQFVGFLERKSLGKPQPNQWEVTYVNHLPKGTVWNVPEDWCALFPSLVSLSSDPADLSLESFTGAWKYQIDEKSGRLHVEIGHGAEEGAKQEELLIMKLTARGPISRNTAEGQDLDEGLNLGRETIVKAFKDLTSQKAHEYWGLIHEHNAVRRS